MGPICPGGSPELLAAGIVIGLSNGALIALIAIGYTLVYGIIELINFSHGDLFMLGTFVALTVLTALGFASETGTTPWAALGLALIAAMLFCGILNVLAERIAFPIFVFLMIQPSMSMSGIAVPMTIASFAVKRMRVSAPVIICTRSNVGSRSGKRMADGGKRTGLLAPEHLFG